MLINTLNVQSTNESHAEPSTSSIDNRFEGIVALFGYNYLSSDGSRIRSTDFAQETSSLIKN